MVTIAKEGGKVDRKLIPPDLHNARCYKLVHLGTQEAEWKGVKTLKYRIKLTFELPDCKAVFKEENGEQPFSISSTFTLSLHENGNLRPFLESWRGKPFTDAEGEGFDVESIVGHPCRVQVMHQEGKNGTYAYINSIMPLKAEDCSDQINSTFIFDLADYSDEDWDQLSKYEQEVVEKSQEYKMKNVGTNKLKDIAESDEPGIESVPF